MTTRRTTRQNPAPSPPPAATGAPSPEERFAAHARTGERGLCWYHELGRLALACCPPRTPGRRRLLDELAAGHPSCSASQLYRVMKFASQHSAAEVTELVALGIGWDSFAQLLALAPDERLFAAGEVACSGLNCRQARLWRAEVFGTRPPRGGRPTAPLPDLGPAGQARVLAAGCHRLVAAHASSLGVFEQLNRDIDAGNTPDAGVLTQVEAARAAVRTAVSELEQMGESLDRIVSLRADRCGAPGHRDSGATRSA